MTDLDPPPLELSGVQVRYGPVQALRGAGLRLCRGEIHALLGENGAGKSTLVAVAAGQLQPDAGTILRDGQPVRFRSPRDARRQGIALVTQHDRLAEAFSVADNLALLDPEAPFFEAPRRRRERVLRLEADLGLELGDPDALVGMLGVGTRQRIEIAGALTLDPAILILDEPTAVLSPDEREALFSALRARAAAGRTILLITHRLGEVFETADRLTLLARGRTVLTAATTEIAPAEVARRLIEGAGLAPGMTAPPSGSARDGTGAAVLALSGFRPGREASPLSFEVARSETLVLLAIDGNGADRIASAIAGVDPHEGSVSLGGHRLPAAHPPAFRAAGGAYVPADRRNDGIFARLSLAENLALAGGKKPFFLDRKALDREAARRIEAFGIRASGAATLAGELSGGNQQKLLLARELDPLPRLLVAVHPTRGLDMASAAEVLRQIEAARNRGTAVLLVTADPEEARTVGGSIRVVYRGELSPPLPPSTETSVLGRRMAGLAA